MKHKGPGPLEYTLVGVFIGFVLAGALVQARQVKNETKVIPPVQATASATPVVVVDDRIAKLERFFGKYSSPLATLSAEFVKQADEFGIGYKILPAIAGAESTFCRNYIEWTNNCFGYGPHIPFPSVARSIRKISWQIGASDLYAPFQRSGNIYELALIYNQSNPKEWTEAVTYFMEEIE